MPLVSVEQYERTRARLKQLLEARWAAEAKVAQIAAGAPRSDFANDGLTFDDLMGEADGQRREAAAGCGEDGKSQQ